ncbi:hypothetical protein [Pseudoalteromonas luteoviolacea]|uniref:Uncharacterized protein n=1 Tax=Pseudoalteromonas luteoviolacea H33 TaxID=1365251 RepID=A0A167EE45_9GAMM|nr:hypothetical protein [Pseudoalteromonas luteoviolacea]KZN50630.1 hypothetical protein N476_15175 [Pseudoalteromonas luteoviolacea H33]KZN77574.1 hypothetical protein N477_11420 [Pseudoalteromonas luteoviolacea H33-S]MBQ4877533.1 hypothetical protein [Pseudoalteromonas luteoviolacea]MBQ4906568.1 hypothetical protein [Pseudoalteromonas luteoviolacea]
MMLRQYLTGIVFLLMAVPSSSQYIASLADMKGSELNILVTRAAQNFNPSNYAYLRLKQIPEQLTDEQVQSLRRTGYPIFAFEWAIRLVANSHYEQAWLLIEKYWQQSTSSARIRLLDLLEEQGEYALMTRIFDQLEVVEPYASIYGLEVGNSISTLNKASVDTLGVSVFGWHTPTASCKYSIILFAETLSGVKQLKRLRAQYNQSTLSELLPYCLSDPLYVGDLTQCSGGESNFIKCNIDHLLQESSVQQARHLVIMTNKQGLANVYNGVMRLHNKSQYELFVHEMMHFAHFEDEYPVPQAKADWLCKTSGYKAPNLYVGTSAPKGWYKSETCKFGQLASYKPQHIASKMQYHEIHLSNHYLGLWLKSLNRTLSVPSDYQVYLNELNAKH